MGEIETQIKYAGYLRRESQLNEQARAWESHPIPETFAFRGLSGLSREIVEKLDRVRPRTLAQASRIPGVTPAAVSVLMIYLKRATGAHGLHKSSGPKIGDSEPSSG